MTESGTLQLTGDVSNSNADIVFWLSQNIYDLVQTNMGITFDKNCPIKFESNF